MPNRLVIVGLGSNEEPLKNLRESLLHLRRDQDIKILKVSKIYESEAQLPNDAPESWRKNYLNAAVLLEVNNFKAIDFLKKIKELEKKIGRKPAQKWAPRIIDLDILYVENFNFNSDELIIPHPWFFRRPFAWRPAIDVFPGLILPDKIDSEAFNTVVSKNVWPEMVGILNVTPDSFSDGGMFNQQENFLDQARKLIAEGADYLDIGAESTRPGASALDTEQEMHRLHLAFEWLQELKTEGLQFKTSLDSRHYESIRYISENYQIDLVNDVSGLQDRRVLDLVKKNNFQAVCMHSLSVPANRNLVLKSLNPIEEIQNWWIEKESLFRQMDFSEESILDNIFFDPGFGFGKTTDQSHYLFNHLSHFAGIKQKIFLGYSRKSFLQRSTEKMTEQVNLAFCQFLRVHDVRAQKKVLLGL